MDRFYQLIKNIFSLSYNEARGFTRLLIASFFALFLILFPRIFFQKDRDVDFDSVRKLDSLAALLENSDSPNISVSLFLFDPNTISLDSLLLLGFPKKVAERTINYRTKGGRFYVKEDVKKIYGITDELNNVIYPFISLPDSLSATDPYQKNQKIDLNLATVDQLKMINIVDGVYAGRIIQYRKLLGGFVKMDQLEEVYDLPKSVKEYLYSISYIRSGFKPILVKINHDTLEVLQNHPYISRRLAEDIIRFREINGSIKSEKLLADFKSIDKGNFQKLIFYLDFQ